MNFPLAKANNGISSRRLHITEGLAIKMMVSVLSDDMKRSGETVTCSVRLRIEYESEP
jgi:hypothetical protein